MNNNSKIYLCHNIKLDKSYKNVLNYTETQMLSLCDANKIAYSTTYSFIKHGENSIKVDFTYSDCLGANYIAFQNYDYNNKWFFAFINSVEYVSDKATIINFEVDVWATWFNSLTVTPCFVVREHVNSDRVGEHLIPEGLETGDYICMYNDHVYSGGDTYIAIASSDQPDEIGTQFNTRYNGIYSGTTILLFETPLAATNYLRAMDYLAMSDAIISVFLVPVALVPESATFNTVSILVESGPPDPHYITTKLAVLPNSDDFTLLETCYNIVAPATLDGYTPKNNKMFTGDYCYFYITNNTGVDVPFRYEDFLNNTGAFKTIGAITPGCSIRCVPISYKRLTETANDSFKSYNSGISVAKYPICSWKTDVYTNWLTENGVNLGWTATGGVLGIVGGAALALSGIGVTAGLGLMATGAGMILQNIRTEYQHSLTPDQAKGNSNTGDITYSAGKIVVDYYKMTVKYDAAASIDSFFTMFGYKVVTLKTPNITGRTYWNYIQIGEGEVLGYGNIPQADLDKINMIARHGTTIWHNHTNIGNYNLNNTIVT